MLIFAHKDLRCRPVWQIGFIGHNSVVSFISNEEILNCCPITEIPALKVGHACTASTATAECGDATTTHLECSTTSLVCVCSAGYIGATGGDCCE